MQHTMATYSSSNITTELIQKYLDENKQLILAILDNQNLGKLNECATYQAKLQQNLMYLAAIADAQPQGGHIGQSSQMQAPQPLPLASTQPGQTYMQQQQQQQINMMNQRNAMMPSYFHQTQQAPQQSFYNQQSLLMSMSHDRGMGVQDQVLAAAGYGDGGRDVHQMSMTMPGHMHHGGNGTDLRCGSHGDGGNGQGNDDSEASYLKGSDGSSGSGAL